MVLEKALSERNWQSTSALSDTLHEILCENSQWREEYLS